MRTKEESRLYMAKLREFKRVRSGQPKRGRGRPRKPDHLLSDDALRMRELRERRIAANGDPHTPLTDRRGYRSVLCVDERRMKPKAYRYGVFAEERGGYTRNGVRCYGFCL